MYLNGPEPNRTLQILEIGLLELVNGGAEQFFVNLSGNTAPEAVAAYKAIGSTQASNAVAKGMSYFPKPYRRDREARLAAERSDPTLSDQLDALSDAIRDSTSKAMIAYAIRENVLPR